MILSYTFSFPRIIYVCACMHACMNMDVYRLGEGSVGGVGVGDVGLGGRLFQVVELAGVRGKSWGIEVCPQLPKHQPNHPSTPTHPHPPTPTHAHAHTHTHTNTHTHTHTRTHTPITVQFTPSTQSASQRLPACVHAPIRPARYFRTLSRNCCNPGSRRCFTHNSATIRRPNSNSHGEHVKSQVTLATPRSGHP